MLKPASPPAIPEMTCRIAQAAFPKGNLYLRISDEVGTIYTNAEFAPLYSETGQPAVPPWRLALVTVMQYVENLTDRQAADAVRGRIDWKYALALELDDPGFDFSVLSEFRHRLLTNGQEGVLLEKLLERLAAQGLLKGKGTQRTDATHVVAKIRRMNRLEMVGETVRRALNAVALTAPDWLKERLPGEWVERYGRRFDAYRLPKSKEQQQVYATQVGQDGYRLMELVFAEAAPQSLRRLQSVEILRQIWVQQYYWVDGAVSWRTKQTHGRPPASRMIASPDEVDARYGGKRQMFWTGYKVHLTETCAAEAPHVLTHVATTPATTNDVTMTPTIQTDLAQKGCQPKRHLVDGGYVDLEVLRDSQTQGIDLVGPIAPDRSWQAQQADGFDHTRFIIDWAHQQATCPQGKQSMKCSPGKTRAGQPNFHFYFSIQDCQPCPARERCTRAQKAGRRLCVFPPEEYQRLLNHRQRQQTEAFKQLYQARAGVEGTVSQAVNGMGIRYARYRGLAKTHLQNIATATAINFTRIADWLAGKQPETTRSSPLMQLAAPA